MEPITVHTNVGSGDVVAGTLFTHHRRGSQSATFTYDPSYVATPGAYAIDPQVPLSSGPWHTAVGQVMFGALSDCAPDRWGRTLLKRQEAALAVQEDRAARELGEADYLLGVRDDLRQGALRLSVDGGPFLARDATGVPTLTELPELLHIAADYENDEAGIDEIRRLVGAGSSLGGARPKTHVRDDDGRLAIAKFPSRDDGWEVMAWEKVALDLAAAAGISTPRSRLVTIAGRRVLILDRFDRARDGTRVGYASAMTMLEAVDREPRTYLEIAQAIEVHSDRATADLHELWRRIVLGVLLHNTDDHLRNHGFLHAGAGRWRLSPAFDVNPNPDAGTHATVISDARPDATIDAALAEADYFRLDEAEAQRVLADVVAEVRRWPDVAAAHGLGRAQVDRMAPAFAASAT